MAIRGILIGLGNPIMSDDGAGLVVSGEVHRRLTGFDLDLSCSSGFDIVDRILGYQMAVIIDAMVSGKTRPGGAARLDPGAGQATLRSREAHGVGFAEAIETARSFGAAVPGRVLVYGIEVIDPFTVGSRMSQAVLDNIAGAAEDIAQDVVKERSLFPCTNSE